MREKEGVLNGYPDHVPIARDEVGAVCLDSYLLGAGLLQLEVFRPRGLDHHLVFFASYPRGGLSPGFLHRG